jgi:nicotinate phosphoribosyltransferase
VRIDSGDLVQVARAVRRLLDDLGAAKTRIVATSDLDEFAIATLRREPVDGFGVGTSVVTGSGAPTAGFVYKLVARGRTPNGPLEPVAKTSVGKASHGGTKFATRALRDGIATAEVIYVGGEPVGSDERPLTVPLVRRGESVAMPGLNDIRKHHQSAMAELPPQARDLSAGEPVIPTRYEEQK